MDNDMEKREEEESQYQRPSMRGRPAKYEDADELQDAISGYFNGGMKYRKVVVGRGKDMTVEMIPVPTITGLVLYLGFADRASFYDLEKQPQFSHTIKKARTFIENEYEEQLATGGGAAAIFALKNFGWHDKTELEVSPGAKSTEEKLKEFMDNTNDGAYPDEITGNAGSIESTAAPTSGSGEELAPSPQDIS